MARKKAKLQDGWNTWETRPVHGASVIVKLPGGEFVGEYFTEGIDGIVQFEDSVMEIEEHLNDSQWKPNETKPDETETEVFRDSEFKMLEKEYNQMISEWMKNNRGTVVTDLSTNIPPRNLGEKKVPVLVLSFNSGLVAS